MQIIGICERGVLVHNPENTHTLDGWLIAENTGLIALPEVVRCFGFTDEAEMAWLDFRLGVPTEVIKARNYSPGPVVGEPIPMMPKRLPRRWQQRQQGKLR